MLRRITIEDYSTLVPLVNNLKEESKYTKLYSSFVFTEEVLKYYISNPNERITLGITNEDTLVGFCVFETQLNLIARLAYVYIEKEHRAKGFMSEVIDALEYWAKQIGCTHTYIGVSNDADLTSKGYQRCEVVFMKEIE